MEVEFRIYYDGKIMISLYFFGWPYLATINGTAKLIIRVYLSNAEKTTSHYGNSFNLLLKIEESFVMLRSC